MTKSRILIVEDDVLVAQNLTAHLEHIGYEVLARVASGAAALASVAAIQPDLVMMDIVLEGPMDGIHAAQQIRSRFDVPVLYLTTYLDEPLFQRAKVTEPFAYLLKPFNERELQLTIEMALYRHQMERRLRTSEAQLANERHQQEVMARERAEQALLESEGRYRSIVEASPDAIIVFTNGSVTLANAAANRLLGMGDAKALLGLAPEALVHPDFHEKINQRMESAVKNHAINPLIPLKMLRRDGGTVDVETVSFAFEDMGMSSILVMVRDVSERIKTDEMIRRFRVALDSSPDAVFLIDRATLQFIDINETACTSLGYSREMLLSMGLHDIKPLFNKQMLAARFDMLLDNIDRTGIIETLHQRKDNSQFPVEITVRALESEGRPMIVAIARDITQRYAAEEALRDSEEKLRQLAENIREVFWVRDDESERILYVSPAYEAVWGRTCASLIERPRSFLAAVHPEDAERVASTFILHHADGSAYEHKYRIVRPDGSIRWIWARVSPIRDTNGKVYRTAGIAEDITERMQSEAARLEHEIVQRDTLVREVHHRIKNNLQGVVGLLRQQIKQHPKVKSELESAIAQINSISLVYGLQSEDMREQVRLCDMVSGIRNSAQQLMQAAIEPTLDMNMVRPVKVSKDEAVPIALILNELIYNAIKHSESDRSCQPIRVVMSGDATAVTVQVQNRCASLPAGFDFPAGKGLGTGLGLVKSLLPRKGAQLAFTTEADVVTAQLVLVPPVIVNDFTQPGSDLPCDGWSEVIQ